MATSICKPNLPATLLRNSRAFPAHLNRSFNTISIHNTSKPDSSVFKITPEIRHAVATGTPVVALESQIYTHGYGYRSDFAEHLELLVRTHGAVPATIAVLDGVARVGLSKEELQRVVESAGKEETMKVSRRDLGFIAGQGIYGKKLIGGTTISATMLLAQKAGIEILGTGGLGGVHRDVENSLDISADLTELGRTRVTVVCSGCKSFLDLPRTLEFLETHGVCVTTFAEGKLSNEVDFPGFLSRRSRLKSPSVVRSEREAAAVILGYRRLEMDSGIVLAVPIPDEYAINNEEMDQIIEGAIREAANQGYSGASNTPFVLARIKESSGENSISASTAMIEVNVEKAAKVAVELTNLSKYY